MTERERRKGDIDATMAKLEERERRLKEIQNRLRKDMSPAQREAMDRRSSDARAEFEKEVAAEPYTTEEQGLLDDARQTPGRVGEMMARVAERDKELRVLRRHLDRKGPARGAAAGDIPNSRETSARMLTYRLMPVWIFLVVFGITLVWESGVRGNAITTDKLQAAALISLIFSLIIGAVVGIRFFNPQPPKA